MENAYILSLRCKATGQCFSFSTYTSEFQFGMCREWLDQSTPLVSSHSETWSFNQGQSISSQRCKSCSSHTNCSSCLTTLNCGWCFDRDNPIQGNCNWNVIYYDDRYNKWLFFKIKIGICMHGDFNSSTVACGIALNSSITEVEFAYAQCPDVSIFNNCCIAIYHHFSL